MGCQHLKLVGARVCAQPVPEPQDRYMSPGRAACSCTWQPITDEQRVRLDVAETRGCVATLNHVQEIYGVGGAMFLRAPFKTWMARIAADLAGCVAS